jgi:hypothetical protein
MRIAEIFVSQRKLRLAAQLPAMRETLADACLPRITLGRGPDGQVQVEDGHHRLAAIWLMGRRRLRKDEFLLVEKETPRPRFGKVRDLLARCGIECPDGEADVMPCF